MAEPGKLSLTSTLLLIVGAGFVVVGWLSLRDDRNVVEWPSVEGRIVSARAIEEAVENTNSASGRKRVTTRHSAELAFEYSVAGETRRGNRIQRREPAARTQAEIEELLARFPVGRSVKVYYDPRDPDRSVLVSEPASGGYAPIVFGATLLLVGVAIRLLTRRGIGVESGTV